MYITTGALFILCLLGSATVGTCIGLLLAVLYFEKIIKTSLDDRCTNKDKLKLQVKADSN